MVFSGGASTRWSRVPGLDKPSLGVAGFRKLDDLATIRAAVDRGAKRAVVLGGGRNGFELVCPEYQCGRLEPEPAANFLLDADRERGRVDFGEWGPGGRGHPAHTRGTTECRRGRPASRGRA